MKKLLYSLLLLSITACFGSELPEVKSPCASIDSGSAGFSNPCVRRPVGVRLV